MKKLTSIILFALLLCTTNLSFAQEPTLTKKQMYKDFDQMVKIIEDCNVQLPVRKAVTGIDNFVEIKKLRKGIDTVTINRGFDNILHEALDYLLDKHSTYSYYFYSGYENLDGIDTICLLEKQQVVSDFMNKINESARHRNFVSTNFPIPILYSYKDNLYYLIGDNHYKSKTGKDTLKTSLLKVISYNGEDIKDYANRDREKRIKSYWDYDNKKYNYNKYGTLWLDTVGRLKVEKGDSVFEFNLEDYIYDIPGWGGVTKNIKIKGVPKGNNFFGNDMRIFGDSILYVFIKSMVSEDTALCNKIKAEAKGKNIKKVVIDVRGNKGGSDYTWHNVLKAIVKDTLPYPIKLAYNDTKMMRKKLKGLNNYTKTEKIPWLGDKRFRVMQDTNMKLAPDTNSIKYDGKIYILYDQSTYSAAYTLVTYSEYLDNLVSVGYSSGQILGFGIMPSLFQLKHSKYTFRLATTIDITNCNKPSDVYHDKPEIEVNPKVEEELLYPYSTHDTRSQEYLYKYDSWFKKVLELE
ncbi:MAG: S41 family peptidase [Bacteroidales bacterium]